VEFGADVKLY